MVMVVKKILEEYLELIQKRIYENKDFIEMQNLASINNLKILFTTYEVKSFNKTLVYISVSAFDTSGKIYEIPETSDFYDEIGSVGGSENILAYKKNISSIQKYELSNEFWDDIKISIEYLKSIKCNKNSKI